MTVREVQVLTSEQLQTVLGDISFKNTALDFKWSYEISECRDENNLGWFVNVSFERPDTVTGLIGVGRGRKEFVGIGSWESSVVKTGWLLVELVVRHELMEAFRWRGRRIFNPHNSIYDLAAIQGDD